MKIQKNITQIHKGKRDIHEIMYKQHGESYLEYRKNWDKSSIFDYEPVFPIHIDFELNYSCNLKCSMCPHGIPSAPKPEYYKLKMPVKLYENAIDEGLKHGLKSIRLNQLNEPLLRKDLPYFIQYAKKKGIIDIMINTNAMLLDKEWCEVLIKSGLTQLRISLDALTKEVYEKVRENGNFYRVIKNIFSFLEIREKLNSLFPTIRVSFVRTSENEQEAEAFVNFWEKIADSYAISNFVNWDTDNLHDEKFPIESKFDIKGFRCEQPFQRATIFSNGDFIPCCSEFYRYDPAGNIYENSIYEIWNSEKLKDLRIACKKGALNKIEVCKKCLNNMSG
jgi:MoaA/NifB/PqqE/SkfB family radical SAM enzyme